MKNGICKRQRTGRGCTFLIMIFSKTVSPQTTDFLLCVLVFLWIFLLVKQFKNPVFYPGGQSSCNGVPCAIKELERPF